MDKLVRKIEVPLAGNAVRKAGLDLVPQKRLGELTDMATDAYQHCGFQLAEQKPVTKSNVMHYAMTRNPM